MSSTAQVEGIRTVDGIEVPAPGTYVFDDAHTSIEFVGRHMMVTKVRGRFDDFTGRVVIAENPLDMCTTSPPAKSIALALKIHPSLAHTMCATGQYTTSSQMVMKAIQTLNFIRSAIAPRISAGVMMANIPWNMTKTYSGMLRGGLAKFAVTESMNRWGYQL